MAHRKSLMHPRLEELSALSPTASPLRRRSSVIHEISNIEPSSENDDETERLQRRMENSRRSVDSDRRRSMGLSLVSKMSNPQIAEGVTECIKLSAENKINAKNAFSLKMIDFMTYMVKKSSASMDDLQMASTSLDVSTKIYGFRVDSVHHDILKMSGGLQQEERRERRENLGAADENGEMSEDTEGSAMNQPKKKKKSRAKILVGNESLKRKIDTIDPISMMMGDSDCQTTDMLYQAVLPVHANNDLYLHAYQDVILDTVNPEKEARVNNAPVNCPKLERFDNLDICSSFANFEFLGWSPEQEIDSSPKEKSPVPIADDGFRFDLDASLPADEDDHFGRSNAMDYYDAEENENAEGCQRIGTAPANIVDFREVIMNANEHKNFEYSYVNERINLQNAGPSHWKIRFPVKNLGGSRVVEGCGQQPVKRRKDIPLVFDEETSKICMSKFDVPTRKKTQLSEKTTRSRWSEERITLPRDVDYDTIHYCKYYIRPDVLKNFPPRGQSTAVELPDELADYNYNNANDTLEYCPDVDNDDDHHVDNNDNINNGIMGSEEEVAYATQGFTGENLVEAPKMTNKICIAFSQRSKKVDMRALKKAMWKMLSAKTNDKENDDNNKVTEEDKTEKVIGMKKFSDIYGNLPEMLTKSNAESVSIPIAFMSLLHLANEKSLQINSSEDCSDVYVRQG